MGADGDNTTALAGINVQVIKGTDQFYLLRSDVEAAYVEQNNWNDAKWRNASGTFSSPLDSDAVNNNVWGITNRKDNTGAAITAESWLNAKLNGRTEIEITLVENVLNVKETVFTTKTEDTVYATFTYSITGMTANCYTVYFAAQSGTKVDSAAITSYIALSENQATSLSLTATGYMANLWTSEIRKGEKLVFTGSVTLTGVDAAFNSWDGPVLGLYSSGSIAVGVMRLDSWLNGFSSNSNGFELNLEGLHYACTQSGTLTQGQTYALTLTIDWTNEGTILYKAKLGDNYTSDWTVTATANRALANAYVFDLGGEDCTMNITSIVRTGAASTKA